MGNILLGGKFGGEYFVGEVVEVLAEEGFLRHFAGVVVNWAAAVVTVVDLAATVAVYVDHPAAVVVGPGQFVAVHLIAAILLELLYLMSVIHTSQFGEDGLFDCSSS